MQKKKISVSLPLVIGIVVVLLLFILLVKSCSNSPKPILGDNIANAQAVENDEVKEFADSIVNYILNDDFASIVKVIDFDGYIAYKVSQKNENLLSGKVEGVKLANDKLDFETVYSYCKSFDENGYEKTVEQYGAIYSSSVDYGEEQEMDVFKNSLDTTFHEVEDTIIKEIYENYRKNIKLKKVSNASKSKFADYIYKVDVSVDMNYYNNAEEKQYKGNDTIYLIKRNDSYYIIYSEWLDHLLEKNNISLSNTFEHTEWM